MSDPEAHGRRDSTCEGRTIRQWIIAGLDEYSDIGSLAEMERAADRLLRWERAKARAEMLRELEGHRAWMESVSNVDDNARIAQEAAGWCEGYDGTLAEYEAELAALESAEP